MAYGIKNKNVGAVEVPMLSLVNLDQGASNRVGRAERNYMREASEELIPGPRTQKRRDNAPGLLQKGMSSSSALESGGANLSGLLKVGNSFGSTDKMGSGGNLPTDLLKRFSSDAVADTPRAVIGTPRTGAASGTPRERTFSDKDSGTPRDEGAPMENEMPPPDKHMRGRRKSDQHKDLDVYRDVPALQAVSSAGAIISNNNAPKSVENSQRSRLVGNTQIDILKPKKNSVTSRRKSQETAGTDADGESDEGNVRSHRRSKSGLSDHSKKFVPKAIDSFGDRASVSTAFLNNTETGLGILW